MCVFYTFINICFYLCFIPIFPLSAVFIETMYCLMLVVGAKASDILDIEICYVIVMDLFPNIFITKYAYS